MISERYLTLVGLARRVGYNIDISSLKSRIDLQKRTYFLQELGADLGYNFGWYVYGPYSTDLTREAYGSQGLESATNIPQIDALSQQVPKKTVEKSKRFFEEVGNQLATADKDDQYWLELMSSLHFLVSKASPAARTRDEAFSKLSTIKPGRFDHDDMTKAWDFLAVYGMVLA